MQSGGELAQSGMAGMGERGKASALATLLALTSDAVVIFDGEGRIRMANEEAERLFRMLPGSLAESDVRLLFVPVATMETTRGSMDESLPFPLDGTTTLLTCEGSRREHLRVYVRCERLSAPIESYLLVAHEVDSQRSQGADERLVEELSRANRRLSGTLGIVLGTLDSLDVGTLFTRILEEIATTMDAWAALAYVADPDGYRLRGFTDSLEGVSVPTFVSFDDPLADLVVREGKSLRMHVRPLTRDELRRGAVQEREVVEESTGTTRKTTTEGLPPFPSFVMVPVWFGGHMIAVIVVGWRNVYRLRSDDTKLLDSVAEYLSVQLAGAFAALRAQHADKLDSLALRLRERLLGVEQVSADLLRSVFEEAAQGLDATLVSLEGNPHQRTTMAVFPVLGVHCVPIDLPGICRTNAVPYVCDVADLDGLAAWLVAHGEPADGLMVALGSADGAARGFLILRQPDDEPFGEVDVAFVRRLAEDVCEVEAGERARSRDKRISQALQRGMRNELQSVDGLSAQSRYSSATEAAYVGGDFYDLVRLPERRACVIMGDVSGKGVEAASVSSAVKTALGAYAWEGLRPARMVRLLNDFLLGFSRVETFATLFVGIVDLERDELVYCSAGHPPALLVRHESGELVTLGVQSGVVGAFEGMRYRDGTTSLRAGDVLLLYTDGVTEARNPQGAFFGEDGLRDVVSREVALGFEGLCDRVLQAVASFAGGSLEDDVALVVLRYDDAT